jgi:NADH-quinone oxidoreductase subunit E
MTELDAAMKSRFDQVRALYPEAQAAVIPLLHLMQASAGTAGPEAQRTVAEYLGVPLVKVHEVVSFYTMLDEKPRGRHHIMVCKTLSCALRGSQPVFDALVRELGIQPGQVTADGAFSLEAVECLGACDMGAAIQVGDRLYGQMDEEKALRLLKQLRAEGGAS